MKASEEKKKEENEKNSPNLFCDYQILLTLGCGVTLDMGQRADYEEFDECGYPKISKEAFIQKLRSQVILPEELIKDFVPKRVKELEIVPSWEIEEIDVEGGCGVY